MVGIFLVLVSGAHAGTTTYNCNNCPVTIIDLGTVDATLQVNDRCDEIGDINVSINISHTFDSDLNVDLIGPTAASVRLWDALGGSGDGFNVTIDDEAAANFTCAAGPCNGTFRPEDFPVDALSVFDGTDAVGVWTLRVADTVGADVGTINTWSIELDCAVVPADLMEFETGKP
jgi:subtilisin-like proprotein convertase family protein